MRFLEGRRRVLGRRYWLHEDPELAVQDLVEQIGGRALAHMWALRLVDAFDSGRVA